MNGQGLDEQGNQLKSMQHTENKYTIALEEDPETGDLLLPLTPEILKQVGWDFGDTILWEDMKNGSFILKKKEKENDSTLGETQ